jgi:antirestriction protein ArdC
MARYNKSASADTQSAEDKALDLFAEMMIDKIKSINQDWKKPWFSEGALRWPKNLNGREYNGMNAMMLLMQCEKNGYDIARFCTFDAVQRLNKTEKKDANGEALPRVSILKGEKSFPVMLTTFTCVDKDTKERIKYDDYKNLSEEERKRYNVYPKLQVFRVFNVAQTNLKEARPELWAKLEAENEIKKPEKTGKDYKFEPVDRMIRDQQWICPIKPTHGDEAYFSISKNQIVVPEKEQFKDGESFYSNLFHEMSHSTGHESQLGRIKPTSFGSEDYAREELVAELSAALTAQRYGMSKHIKDDSASYLKSWLGSLQQEPQFIKSTLLDVKKASSMLSQHIDKIAMQIEQERNQDVSQSEGKAQSVAQPVVAVASEVKTETKEQSQTKEETVAAKSAPSISTPKEPTYYASVVYLQSTDDTQLFDRLQEQGDYKRILQEASEYDYGDAPDLSQTFKSPTQNRNDDLLDEDDHYAVVYNNSVGGTYEVFRKITESQVQENLTRYGLPDNATKDVQAVAAKMPEFQNEEQSHGMHR